MRRFMSLASVLFLAVVLVIAAAPAVQGQTPPSPFAGNYAGPFTTAIAGGGYQTGYITLTVDANGKSVSRITNFTLGLSGTATSFVTHKGESYGTLVCDNGLTYTLQGTFRKDKNGTLRGTVCQYGANGLIASCVVNLPAR